MMQGWLGGGGGGGGSADGWFNVSEYIGDLNLLAGAPTRDTSGQWVSGSSDATGTTMTVSGAAASGVNLTGYVGFIIDPVATMLPGLPLDGTALMEVRATAVTDAPIGANYLQTLRIGENDPTLGLASYGLFYYASTTTYQMGITQSVSLFSTDHTNSQCRQWTMAIPLGGDRVGGTGAGTQGSTAQSGNAANSFYQFSICAGTRTATGGPRSAKILWECRGVNW